MDNINNTEQILNKLEKTFGAVPEVFEVMIPSEPLISSVNYMRRSLSEIELSPVERQLLVYFFSFLNESGYCVEIHHELLTLYGFDCSKAFDEEEFYAFDDKKIVSLLRYAKELHTNKGMVSKEAIEKLTEHGYTEKNRLEILLILTFSYSVNVTSRHFNLKSFT